MSDIHCDAQDQDHVLNAWLVGWLLASVRGDSVKLFSFGSIRWVMGKVKYYNYIYQVAGEPG